MSSNILTLKEISNQAVGGKARGLAELIRQGLNVPPAFVIPNAKANQHPDDLDEHYQAIGGGLVAVRSSAIGEDGDESSFAGQYETLLNISGIENLKQAINQCIASLSSEHANAYKAEQADLDEVDMCVVVQRMVDPRAAGVLFTADPVSGRHDRLIIDAVAGLGEALVSGEITPDHFELDPTNTITHSELSASAAILDQDDINRLASQARQAADAINPLLDMEWAIDKSGELFWLQARPITT